MKETYVYDKAKWHYGGDYPDGLPEKQAYVHTGMFFGWIIENDLYSNWFGEDLLDLIASFKAREKTGAEIYEFCDGVLISDMLTEEANAFAEKYFVFETGDYLQDYIELLGKDLPNLYFVEDSWENYDKLKTRINERYQSWQKNGD